jgi:hypothetical protein
MFVKIGDLACAPNRPSEFILGPLRLIFIPTRLHFWARPRDTAAGVLGFVLTGALVGIAEKRATEAVPFVPFQNGEQRTRCFVAEIERLSAPLLRLPS